VIWRLHMVDDKEFYIPHITTAFLRKYCREEEGGHES
jgi:hypothetical protein